MKDKYTNFAQLQEQEKRDKDYTISHRDVNSKIAVIAPHGGGIEPGTIDIADVLAGCEYTFYAFKALKKTGNRELHISSNRFDEPLGIKATQQAHITITIHGSRYKTQTVHIGGKNQALKQKIMDVLITAGFHAQISEIPGLQGIKPENICNRCKTGRGVQLEVSRGLRESMFDYLDHRRLRKKTIVFYQFVNALKKVLIEQN